MTSSTPYPRRRPPSRGTSALTSDGAATPGAEIHDDVFGFKGHFTAGDARITFAVHDDDSDVVYHSDPDGQRAVSAGVGHEHNGVFF